MKEENKKTIIYTSVIFTTIVLSIGIYYAYGQVPTVKIFRLGSNPSGTLDDFNYTNGDQLQYDVGGYPPVTISINRWNELTSVNKTLITVRLTGMGYVEGEEQTPTIIEQIR